MDGLCTSFGKAKMFDFTFLNQVFYRSCYFFDWTPDQIARMAAELTDR